MATMCLLDYRYLIVYINDSVDDKYTSSAKLAQSPGFLLEIIRWAESGKTILQVSIAVFQALSKYLMAQPPKKLAYMPMLRPIF